jgi:predicted ester cyclase
MTQSRDAATVVRAFIDNVWNARLPSEAFVAPEYRTRMLQPDTVDAGSEVGAAYVDKDVAVWTSAFPDLRWWVDELVTEGASVVVRARLTGTHRAPFLGVQPTERTVEVHAVFLARVADGRIASGALLLDRLGLLQQLGVLQETRTLLAQSHDIARHRDRASTPIRAEFPG